MERDTDETVTVENGERLGVSTLLEQYEASADSFQSDTRRYLKQHLLDQYKQVGEAVSYNMLQNAIDNKVEGQPLIARFVYSTHEKTLKFMCSGTTGVRDWARYNSLHQEGTLGIERRGEGAKVLIPISQVVRTETMLLDGTYKQAIWKEDKIWRSDRDGEKAVFENHFPPSAIRPGSTIVTAIGVYDEVGDRRAGSDLANGREMAEIIQGDWWLYLKEHPEVAISYEVDGEVLEIEPWPMPEIIDLKEFENLEVQDAKGEKIGTIEKLFIALAKTPLKEAPKPGIAFSCGLHIVSYQQFVGPNSNRCFGYVKAPFLQGSETTDHLGFKSTKQYRALREKLLVYVTDFMSAHVGKFQNLSQKDLKAISDVTDQLNQLIKDKFPEWHPEGGFKEKRKEPEQRQAPWIRNPRLDSARYLPGATCEVSFEIVNPGGGRPEWHLDVRAKAVSSEGEPLYHNVWQLRLERGVSKSFSDMFEIPAEAVFGTYAMRLSLRDTDSDEVIDERRALFEIVEDLEEMEEENQTEEARARRPKKTKKTKKRGPIALKSPRFAEFPEEEGVIHESYYDPEENRVIINMTSPGYVLARADDRTYRYYVMKCNVEELAKRKLDREIALLEKEELTKDHLSYMMQSHKAEKATFTAEWARLEQSRSSRDSMGPIQR